MNELLEMETPELLRHRMLKFRSLGRFIEGEAVDPIRKVNMKKKDNPIIQHEKLGATSDFDFYEIEKLKQRLLNSKEETSSEVSDLDLNEMDEMAEKLKKEVDEELAAVVKSMGLMDRLETIRKDITKKRSSPNELMDPNMLEEIEKLKQELKQGVADNPKFANLNYKLDMLKEITKCQKLSERNEKIIFLKQEINKRLKEAMDQTDVKEKMDMLKAEILNAGVSRYSDLDDGLKEKIVKVKKEIESELAKTLSSLHLDVALVASKGKASVVTDLVEQPFHSELSGKLDEFNHEVEEGIEDAINSTELKGKIEMLKLEVAKAGKSPDPETKSEIEAMKMEIKRSIAEAMNSSSLIEKYEKLKQEISSAAVASSDELGDGSSGEFNGGLKQDDYNGDDPHTSSVEINISATNNRT